MESEEDFTFLFFMMVSLIYMSDFRNIKMEEMERIKGRLKSSVYPEPA